MSCSHTTHAINDGHRRAVLYRAIKCGEWSGRYTGHGDDTGCYEHISGSVDDDGAVRVYDRLAEYESIHHDLTDEEREIFVAAALQR